MKREKVSEPMKPILVNIGCGPIFHHAWLNLDVAPQDSRVTRLDVRRGIPLADGTADACFSSHVIEHLSPEAASSFLREQFRVLRPGGVIRVVAPDLESIARLYVGALDAAESESRPTFEHLHAVAELIDQLVRTRPGGQLALLWRDTPPEKRDWVLARMGYVAEGQLSGSPRDQRTPYERLANAIANPAHRTRLLHRLHEKAVRLIVRLCGGGRLATAFTEAAFRNQGDVHLWMYDRITLADSLLKAGFTSPKRRSLGDSDIPQWREYELEIRGGKPLKPNSLVVEATKP